MRMRRCSHRRPGLAALDVVLTAVVICGIAAAGYALVRTNLERYVFTLGNAAGWPLL